MKTNEALDKYLSSLSRSECRATTHAIKKNLDITATVLCNWRRGRTPLHPVFFDKIIEIVGDDIRKFI